MDASDPDFGTFFSVDVETTAREVSQGLLLTVGIVPVRFFEGHWLIVPDYFYARINQGPPPYPASNEHYESMTWWAEQNPEVRGEAYENRDLERNSPLHVARSIANYVARIEPDWNRRFFTANPVSFDKPWIDQLFARFGMPMPFHYRSLCLRSMKFGMNPLKGFGSDRETHESALPHHALYDAEAQAQDLVDMLNVRHDAGLPFVDWGLNAPEEWARAAGTQAEARMSTVVADKFNITSEEHGFSHRLVEGK